MNPLEAFKYMKDTGKSVKAEKTPHWIDNPLWIEMEYQWRSDNSIVTLHKGKVVVDVQDTMDWMNWWMNFCYNTNSRSHNVELIPV